MQKQCKTCKNLKLLSEFKLDKGYFAKICKPCTRVYKQPNKKCFTCHIEKSRNEFDNRKITCLSCHDIRNKKIKSNGYKLRSLISKSIARKIKKNESCFKKLPYTIQELRNHLEKQFESWMTWENLGVYKKIEWKDDNQTTWKWHIDHIIPQSKLPYKSMEDDNFKKCWGLDNLRPYSAKQNILDSNRRKSNE